MDSPPPARTATIALSARELAEALSLGYLGLLRGRSLVWRVQWFLPALIIGSAALSMIGQGQPTFPALLMVAGAAFLLLMRAPRFARWLNYPQAARMLRDRPHLRSGMSLAWDDDGLLNETATVMQRTPWTDVTRWGESRSVLAFITPAVGVVCAPKRFLSAAQQEDLRALARRHGVPGLSEADARPPRAVLAAFEADTRAESAQDACAIAFRLSFDDVKRVNRQHIVLRFLRWQTLAFAALVAAGLWAAGEMGPARDPGAAGAAAAAGLGVSTLVLLAAPWLLVERSVRLAFAQRRDLAGDVRLWWDTAGAHSLSETTEWHAGWAEVRRWREDAAVVWLELARGGVQIIPKRALSPERLADLRRAASQAGVRGASPGA